MGPHLVGRAHPRRRDGESPCRPTRLESRHGPTDQLAARAAVSSPTIRAANARLLTELPFDDTTDFDDDAVAASWAASTRVAACACRRTGASVRVDNEAYIARSLCRGPAPDTVNPRLARHVAKLAAIDGLFEAAEGMYQGPGHGPLEHHARASGGRHRRPGRFDPRRSARRRPPPRSPSTAAPRRPSGRGRHLHPQPYRPLRRRARFRHARRTSTPGRVQILAPEGFLEHSGRGERVRGSRHGPPRRLHVRSCARAWAREGAGRRRPRPDDLDR